MFYGILYAEMDTPVPSKAWVQSTDDERLVLVRKKLEEVMPALKDILLILAAKKDGQVIVSLREPLVAGERGTVLLDVEDLFKSTVDNGIVVWVESLGDRNSLRNLRGIAVKA